MVEESKDFQIDITPDQIEVFDLNMFCQKQTKFFSTSNVMMIIQDLIEYLRVNQIESYKVSVQKLKIKIEMKGVGIDCRLLHVENENMICVEFTRTGGD